MGEALSQPARVEVAVQKSVRAWVDETILNRKISTRTLAKKLDLLPSGAQALMDQQEWSIETALRVAEKLRIRMRIERVPRK